jgi:type II secretory pathway component PulF
MGGALPASTRFLIAVSGIAGAFWPYALALFGGGAVFLGRWTATPAGARARDALLLKIPFLRQVTIQSALVRFTRTLGTLLQSGVSILKSLEIAAGASGNVVFREQIEGAADRVREGAGVAEALRRAAEFPGLLREKIAVGEETGRLPEVLISISEQVEVTLERAVSLFVSVFEPLLIVLMAGIVGFIVISMLLPIFELNSMIQ